MPGISELSRNEIYRTDGQLQDGQAEIPNADTSPKDDPNPRPNEAIYYTNEGPVNPEIAKAAIAQIGINLLVTRRGEINLH